MEQIGSFRIAQVVLPYSHHLALISRHQLSMDEGMVMVGARSSASWGSMYVSQQNGSLDSGWAGYFMGGGAFEQIAKQLGIMGAYFHSRLILICLITTRACLGIVVTFDGRLPRLDQIQMLESATDSQPQLRLCGRAQFSILYHF